MRIGEQGSLHMFQMDAVHAFLSSLVWREHTVLHPLTIKTKGTYGLLQGGGSSTEGVL